MLSGPVAAMRGVATPPHAGAEGLSLLLAVAPVGWVNASRCAESARLGLRC